NPYHPYRAYCLVLQAFLAPRTLTATPYRRAQAKWAPFLPTLDRKKLSAPTAPRRPSLTPRRASQILAAHPGFTLFVKHPSGPMPANIGLYTACPTTVS